MNQENKSKCCGAEKKAINADEGTSYYACSKCLGEFIPQSLEEKCNNELKTEDGFYAYCLLNKGHKNECNPYIDFIRPTDSNLEEQKLREEFHNFILSFNGRRTANLEEISSYWIRKMKEQREKIAEEIEGMKMNVERLEEADKHMSVVSYKIALEDVLDIIKNKE